MSFRSRVGAAILLVIATAIGASAYFGSRAEPALYYRITTDLETEGQPFQLDVVVRCGGLEVLRSGGGGRLSYQQLPYLYGRPTPAGHAVLMRVPDFCVLLDSGDERAKADLQRLKEGQVGLPLVFWMPDKADIDRLTAYTSLKGYESPGSTLRYVRTRFAEATEAEWKSWTAREGRPFVNRGSDPFIEWGEKGPKLPPSRLPLYCAGLRLFPIPPSLRDEVAAAQPIDKPLVWDGGNALYDLRRKAIVLLGVNGRRLQSKMSPGGVYQFGYDLIPYEARTVWASSEPLAVKFKLDTSVTVHRIDLNETARGRAQCRRGTIGYPDIVTIKRGDRIANIAQIWPLYIDTDHILNLHNDTEVRVIDGSTEDTYP